MKDISVAMLLPTHDNVCVDLVAELKRQADALAASRDHVFAYEIIVADDGSRDMACVERNRCIGLMEHCRFVRVEHNVGRACIRNFLVGQSRARYLLFIDSDLSVCSDRYLASYVEWIETHDGDDVVVYGGTRIGGEGGALRGNLRYLYEKRAEPLHMAEGRMRHPCSSLSVCNCLVARHVMLDHPFDQRFKAYGYEDVLLGKRLAESGITVSHIDNPMLMCKFDSNVVFVAKTEEALLTLCRFGDDLRGYSHLQTHVERLVRYVPLWPLRLWHRAMGKVERRILVGRHPSLLVFKLYKLGFYLACRQASC